MIIYDGTKQDYLRRVDDDTLADYLSEQIKKKLNRTTGKSEYRSWVNSSNYMYKILNDIEIPNDAGVAIEYNIPQTSKRVDFLISGYDDRDNENVVVVELKQWDKINPIEGRDGLVETYTGGAMRNVVHPSYQAWSYAALIRDYNEIVQNDYIQIEPCAYLHNYVRRDNDPLDLPQYVIYEEDSPAYTRGQGRQLRNFIKKFIKKGDQSKVIYKIDHGKIKPSKSLQDNIASMIKGNHEFVMIDDQKVAYEEILYYSRQCVKDGKKRTIIVEGGPGTGKTVIAINLLAKLTNEEQVVQYTSKNSAPRNVYLRKLKGTLQKCTVDNMFKGSGSYTDVANNTLDTILADEAHRLNAKSGLYGNQGENQIKEIIHASKCSVFFIDESQKVTMKDIGSIEEIQKWADEEGSEVFHMTLTSQFRCNGSDGYLAWLDNTLEIRDTANVDMNDIDYDIRILDDPEQVYRMVLGRNKAEYTARMLAGYCWEWPSKTRNDKDYHDIQIGDFGISWNLRNSTTYAIDPDSVEEAGCIHTTQGLEFDYVGVIIGEDMRYENGHIVTDFTKRATSDQSLRGIKKLAKSDPEKANEIADEIIKNTYRTLMTRGMKGCYVYCLDHNLAEHLRKSLGE